MAEYNDAEEQEVARRKRVRRIFPTTTKTDLPEEPNEAPEEDENPYVKRIKRFFGGKKGTGAVGKKKKEGAEAQAEALAGK